MKGMDMAKLPVGDTLAFSLRYGLAAVPALIRVGWLPLIVLAAGIACILLGTTNVTIDKSLEIGGNYAAFKREISVMQQDIENMALFVSGVVLSLIGAILFIPVYVAMMRNAAGEAPPGGLVAFRWGGPEWRYIGATLLSVPIFLLAVAVCAIPAIIAIAATGGFEALAGLEEGSVMLPGGGWIVLGMLIGLFFLIWFAIRFSFFAPYAAVKNRIAPMTAFAMTGGNFWRIVVTATVLTILLALIDAAFGAFQVAFGALANLAGTGIGTGEGTALPIGLWAAAYLLGTIKQIYGFLVGSGYSGRVVGVLAEGAEPR
jgi:hypothetical protein